ncbi:MAG: TIGR00269 family protein [Nanoarchaeota archaeon]
MNCCLCSQTAVHISPRYCQAHFIAYFERKVLSTIKKYRLCRKQDRICVAASGGKDSTALLFILRKHFPHVSALAIDEGIRGYRSQTLADLRRFCTKHRITLDVVSFRQEAGMDLDQLVTGKRHPCTVCGILRRHLLNTHAKNYDVLATGHNLDDEAQTILMNLCTANRSYLPHSYPASKKIAGFTRRIKPLYFCTEKEVLLYAVLKGITGKFVECPYMHDSLRNDVRDSLNEYEQGHKGTKLGIVLKAYAVRSRLPFRDAAISYCKNCGEPSASELCSACRIISAIP